MPIRIRDALPTDAPSLASIYAHYVDHTPITFEISPAPTADEMRGRVELAQRLHVWLVAEEYAEGEEGGEGGEGVNGGQGLRRGEGAGEEGAVSTGIPASISPVGAVESGTADTAPVQAAQTVEAAQTGALVEDPPTSSPSQPPRTTILGYAHASPLNPRAAYRWSSYTGIYLCPDPSDPSSLTSSITPSPSSPSSPTSPTSTSSPPLPSPSSPPSPSPSPSPSLPRSVQRKGLGTALYTALIDRLHSRGYRQLFALVTQPNEASNAIHAKLGFERCGVLRRSGYKMGRWWDVWWFQKSIGGEGDEEPEEIR